MRTVNIKIFDAQANATVSSSAVDSSFMYGLSVIADFSDAAAAGTVKIQASNDFTDAGNLSMDFVPTVWVDIASASAAVAAGASVRIAVPELCSRWIRVVWTRSAGAGTFNVKLNANCV